MSKALFIPKKPLVSQRLFLKRPSQAGDALLSHGLTPQYHRRSGA
jgi:hypothetical protein